jgi:hypothetical protein
MVHATFESGANRYAARAIQQELIDDFTNKPELSDWFSRVSKRWLLYYGSHSNSHIRRTLHQRRWSRSQIPSTKEINLHYKNWKRK